MQHLEFSAFGNFRKGFMFLQAPVIFIGTGETSGFFITKEKDEYLTNLEIYFLEKR